MEIMFFVAGGLGVLSILFYSYKYSKRHDFGYLLMIFSRGYLASLWFYHFIMKEHITHETFLCLIAVLMIAEVANSVIFLSSRKFILKIEENKVKEKLLKEYEINTSTGMVGFFIVSDSGKLKYSNQALTEILGFSKQEMLEKNIIDIVHPDDVLKVTEEISLKLKGEKDISIYDFRIIDKQGKVKKVRVISSVITNGHTSIAGSLFLKED